jgi:hypothetical protein
MDIAATSFHVRNQIDRQWANRRRLYLNAGNSTVGNSTI